ncbi:hypothetical protein [Desulfosediminicola flagellatus]|uniref:hypothetical protein n=1 Tax=Desulfosediminicola flagellatus TaxID=2569541 RepID=UPI0012947D8A|nr:hypothetical protein [Desulfosediminicola flagellatus]
MILKSLITMVRMVLTVKAFLSGQDNTHRLRKILDTICELHSRLCGENVWK